MTRFAFRTTATPADEMPTMDVTSPSLANNIINNNNVIDTTIMNTTMANIDANNTNSDETSSKEDEAYTEDNSIDDEEEYLEDGDDDSSRKGKKKRKSHVETKHRKTFMSIDVIAMRSCLHLNQKEAAKKLNVSLSTLKRRFYEMRHELGCDKWPYPPHKPTGGSSGKRKHSTESSDDDTNMPSDEETSSEQEELTFRAKTRRQSVTSLGKRRDSIQVDYVSQHPLDDVTQDTNSSFTYDFNRSSNSFERNSKKLKATHTGFLSTSLPEPSYKLQPSTSSAQNAPQENSDFIFYKDNYEEENSSDGDQSSSAPEMVSDEEYVQLSQKAVKATSSKKKTNCDLKEITKKTQTLDNPREKEIYNGAILLIAFKQQQILSNTL